jgi:hypothetical protein
MDVLHPAQQKITIRLANIFEKIEMSFDLNIGSVLNLSRFSKPDLDEAFVR